jgi:hypothetical protein
MQGRDDQPSRFAGDGSSDQQQAEQQSMQEEQQTTEENAPPSVAPTTTMSTSALPTALDGGVEAIAPAPALSLNLPAVSSSTEAPFVQSSSVVDAILETASSTLRLAGIPLIAPTSTMSNNVASTTATTELIPILSTSSIRSTVTTSMTLWVTPSPAAESTAVPAEDQAPTATEANPSPSQDVAPLSTPLGTTMSAAEQAGMGIGITFGILSIAGATGLYLWRRRRNQCLERDGLPRNNATGGLGRFFKLNSRADTPSNHDPEWSVESSASKVEIMRGGSLRSIRTGTGLHSDTPPSTFPLPGTTRPPLSFSQSTAGGGGAGLEVLKVGMRIPDRKHNLALTSNPPISPSVFPTPPNSSGKDKKSGGSTSSWPLPE